MFDIYKIDVQCKKSNNKHPCEFVLTQAVKANKGFLGPPNTDYNLYAK